MFPDEQVTEQDQVLIFGAGELARLLIGYLSQSADVNITGLVVDDGHYHASAPSFCGKRIIPFSDVLNQVDFSQVKLLPGTSGSHLSLRRFLLHEWATSLGIRLYSYISPHALVSPDAQVGDGCIILENNVVQSGAIIGPVSVLWSGNHIGHLSRIGTASFVTSHVAMGGNSVLGARCYVGMNSVIRDGIELGEQTVVGAMTYVDKSFRGNLVLQGNPARAIQGILPIEAVK